MRTTAILLTAAAMAALSPAARAGEPAEATQWEIRPAVLQADDLENLIRPVQYMVYPDYYYHSYYYSPYYSPQYTQRYYYPYYYQQRWAARYPWSWGRQYGARTTWFGPRSNYGYWY
jgi:hypothetical protein